MGPAVCPLWRGCLIFESKNSIRNFTYGASFVGGYFFLCTCVLINQGGPGYSQGGPLSYSNLAVNHHMCLVI